MARMTSHIASVIRGSVGGLTYSANQYHQIICKARTAPVQPNTSSQSRIKGAFTQASTDWLTQIPAVRDAWADYAESLVYSGPLGDYSVSNRSVFMSNIGFMLYLQSRGVTFTSAQKTAPVETGFLGIGAVTISAPAVVGIGFNVDIDNPNSEDVKAIMNISRPFEVTRERFKGPFDTDSLESLDIETLSNSDVDFDGLVLGKVYFLRLRLIVDDGPKRISTEQIYRCVSQQTVIAKERKSVPSRARKVAP